MEPKFNTSFIPKKPTASIQGTVSSGEKGINFITLLATVIFLAAVLFAAGVFMYKLTIEQRISQQLSDLEKVRQSFEPNFISQATRLNERIVSAQRILNKHLSPSSIFELLEEFTLQTVAFKSFDFQNNIDGDVMIKGQGEGDSFRSIVLQSDEFGRTGFLRDVLFSGLEPNEKGNVDFTFEAVVDPQLILYRKSLVPVGPSNQPIQQGGLPPIQQLNDEDESFGEFGIPQQQQINNNNN